MPAFSNRILFVVASAVVVVDQASKALVLYLLAPGEIVPLISGLFNLTLTFNKGIAFGMLADFPDFWRQTLISLATVIALATIIYFLRKQYRNDSIARIALAMIIGGAVGNMIDRFRLGQVVDFIDVYWSTHHWPAFNVADSAVCVGVFILLFRSSDSKEENLEQAPAS